MLAASVKRVRIARPSRRIALLIASERMGDGRRHRVRRDSVRDLSARQLGIRIDFEGDGDQRERQDDGHGSHGKHLPQAIEAESVR